MQYNHHDLPQSDAERSQRVGAANRDAVDREAIWTLNNLGRPLSEHDPTLAYPYAEMAKVVARRAHLGRSAVFRYLEEASCEDPSAPFVTIDNPNGGGLLIMFKTNTQHYGVAQVQQDGGDHA